MSIAVYKLALLALCLMQADVQQRTPVFPIGLVRKDGASAFKGVKLVL